MGHCFYFTLDPLLLWSTLMVQIEVAARVKLQNLPDHLRQHFIKENTFANPAYAKNKKLGLWTGNMERFIRLHAYEGDALMLPRGYFRKVLETLKEGGIPFEFTDRTVCPPATFTNGGGELYPFQATGLEKLLKAHTGVLEAPTGSGKTNILLSAIPRLQTNTLIIVHTGELLRQTMDRARSWLDIEPGIFGAGKKDLKPLTVGMIQTLAKRDLEEIGAYFGAVMIDECHHSPAVTWARVLQELPAKYKYGFTATAWRKDKLEFLMWRLISDRHSKVLKSDVVEAGKMVLPEIQVVTTPYWNPIEHSIEWGPMITDLTTDQERNALIESEVRNRLAPDIKALILTDRIRHVNTLCARLADLSPVLLTGALTKKDRTAAMEKVRAGAQLTIATTHLLGEGVDVPGWNLLFLASPIAGGPRTLQAAGRIARPAPGKSRAVLVDFLDERVSMLKAAFWSRQRLYKKEE